MFKIVVIVNDDDGFTERHVKARTHVIERLANNRKSFSDDAERGHRTNQPIRTPREQQKASRTTENGEKHGRTLYDSLR